MPVVLSPKVGKHVAQSILLLAQVAQIEVGGPQAAAG